MVQLKCSCCNTDVEQHKTVSCCICKQLFNYSCVKLTQTEARTINANKNLSWTCAKCLPLGADITALKEVVLGLQKEIAQLKDIKINDGSTTFDFEEVICELQEREKRKCNIIIFGVNEEAIQNRDERRAADHQHVLNILGAIPVEMELLKVSRVGAFDPSRPRPRPMRVSLKDEDCVFQILKKKKVLKNSDHFRNVNISTDRTVRQIAVFKEVKAELERRRSEGENNIRIKYVKGMPKIVPLN